MHRGDNDIEIDETNNTACLKRYEALLTWAVIMIVPDRKSCSRVAFGKMNDKVCIDMA